MKTEYSTSLQENMIEKQLLTINQGDKLKNTIEQSNLDMLNTVQVSVQCKSIFLLIYE